MRILRESITTKRCILIAASWSSARAALFRVPGRAFGCAFTTFFYNDVYVVDLPPGHRFPMEKYRLTRLEVQRRLGGTSLARFDVSPLATTDDLETTHCSQYIARFIEGRISEREARVVGFPWSEQSVKRTLSSVGGTVAAMHSVMKKRIDTGAYSFAGHIAGGTHHAFYDRGEGFCIFSDIAVAANVALRDYCDHIRTIAIIDLDVHQGNGNSLLFQDNPHVYTFSLHCSGNYFSKKQTSDVDVELPPGTGDEEYLSQVQEWVPRVLDQQQPDLVFFQAGVDPIDVDRLGQLEITRNGLQKRNQIVYEEVLKRQLPLVVTMGGGYPRDLDSSSRSFQAIVDAHADVYVQAAMAAAEL